MPSCLYHPDREATHRLEIERVGHHIQGWDVGGEHLQLVYVCWDCLTGELRALADARDRAREQKSA